RESLALERHVEREASIGPVEVLTAVANHSRGRIEIELAAPGNASTVSLDTDKIECRRVSHAARKGDIARDRPVGSPDRRGKQHQRNEGEHNAQFPRTEHSTTPFVDGARLSGSTLSINGPCRSASRAILEATSLDRPRIQENRK